MRIIDSKDKALLIGKAAHAKKAEDIIIMDMRGVCAFTDYFVIASGSSNRKVRAIAENIEKELERAKVKPWHIEGKQEALWILLDYGDAIVHIFYNQTRYFYNLERLWADAPQLRWNGEITQTLRDRKQT